MVGFYQHPRRQQQQQQRLLGALVGAVVNQIANSLTDRGYQVSKTAAYNLLSPYSRNGILKGPRFVEEQPK